VAPYDAELFGHWWFEGPLWLDSLLRKIAHDPRLCTITPSEYLKEYPTNQVVYPSLSSWGYKGYNEYWVEGSNDWIYRHLHLAGKRMTQLADRFLSRRQKTKRPLIERALNQAARELLLAQASDWPFIMKTGTMVQYAQRRVKNHLNRFSRIYHDLLEDKLDEHWLNQLEHKDNIFIGMDCAKYFRKERRGQ
jgi:1,4-alpha-glucan branching enzyme